MRKFLSLVLALVMMMSLITINTSAVEFTDDDDITYQEAVDVISAIHVVDGYENGSFNPGGNLTRGAAAKIICNLVLGPTTASQLKADTAPFRDVPVNHEFAGYIAYCQKEGIISGYGDGSFRPAGTLTGNAFMKMLLGALGYDAEIEQYVGPNWSINVAKRAIGIGLDDGLTESFNGGRFLTREEAALYSLNTLQADLVQYENKITASVNGADVTIGNSQAQSRKWDSQHTKYNNIISDDIVQFAEEYFNKLVLTRDVDAFGRPDREWAFDGDDIGAYINMDLLKSEYTTEVKGKDLYDLLGSNAIDNYDFEITIDGVDVDGKTGSNDHNTVLQKKGSTDAGSYFDTSYMTRTYKDKIGKTGNGVLTQVFVEPGVGNEGKVWVAVINTFLAKATADYSEKKDEIDFDVFSMNHDGSGNNAVYFKVNEACKVANEQKERITVAGEDFPEVTEMKKDDIVLVNVANGSIEIISDPEVLSETTLTAFSKNSYVESEGDKYDYSTTVEYDVETLDDYTSISSTQQLKDTAYDVYLDPYGYVIGVKIVEATKNYIFLTGIDQGTSNLKNKTADAAGILTDGTFIEFSMNMKDSKRADGTNTFRGHPLWNTWCTYTVDKNDVYTLTEVGDFDDVFPTDSSVKAAKAGQYHDADYSEKTINDKHVSVLGKTGKYVYGNDASIYIVAEIETVAAKDAVASSDPIVGGMPDGAIASKAVKIGENVGIISGVDSIGTGIANVDLVTWNQTEIMAELNGGKDLNPASYPGNIYTLFDKDGYVIAAVVVGEDNGTSKTLAYSHKDSIAKETYSSADDEWTWERLAIVNGEEVTLTEKGDKISALKNMKQNVWYEIAYKADGTVKEATLAYYDEFGKNAGTDKKTPATDYDHALDRTTSDTDTSKAKAFVSNIVFLENAINNSNKTTVLYEETWGKFTDDATFTANFDTGDSHKDGAAKNIAMTTAPSLIGSTLYVDRDNMRGFYVSQDVKSVLIQKNNGESITDFGEGMSDLEDMLDNLNYDNGTYKFKISAVLTNGRATTVIIHDWNETNAQQSERPNQPTNHSSYIDGNVLRLALVDTAASTTSIYNEAVALLVREGYTSIVPSVPSVAANGVDMHDSLASVTAYKNGVPYSFNVFHTNYWTVTVDDEIVAYLLNGEASSSYTVKEATLKAGGATRYVRNNTPVGIRGDVTISAATSANVITTGYVEYAAMGTTAGSAGGLSSSNVATAKTSDAGKGYVALGKDTTVTVTINTGVTTNAATKITVTYDEIVDGVTFNRTCSDVWEIPNGTNFATATNTKVFTISNVKGDIVNVKANVEAVKESFALDVATDGLTDDARNGVKFRIIDAPATAVDGSTVTVTVGISGKATAETTFELAQNGGSGTPQNFSWTSDTVSKASITRNSNVKITVAANSSWSEEQVLTFNFEMGNDATNVKITAAG